MLFEYLKDITKIFERYYNKYFYNTVSFKYFSHVRCTPESGEEKKKSNYK